VSAILGFTFYLQLVLLLPNPRWWLVLIFIVLCIAVLEYGVSSLRAAWWPTDVDIFQELEHDLEVRKRFEEASAMELQQGWDRGTKKSSIELERNKLQPQGTQQRDEVEMNDMLRERARGLAEEEQVGDRR